MKCRYCSYTCETIGQLSHHLREKHPGTTGRAATKKAKRAKAALTSPPTPPSTPPTTSPTSSSTTKLPEPQTDTNTQAKNSGVSVNIDSTAKSTSMAPLDAQGQFEELLGKWGVEKRAAIAEFVATYGENAFEDRGKECDVCERSLETARGLGAHRVSHRLAEGQPSALRVRVPPVKLFQGLSPSALSPQDAAQPSPRPEVSTSMAPLDAQGIKNC